MQQFLWRRERYLLFFCSLLSAMPLYANQAATEAEQKPPTRLEQIFDLNRRAHKSEYMRWSTNSQLEYMQVLYKIIGATPPGRHHNAAMMVLEKSWLADEVAASPQVYHGNQLPFDLELFVGKLGAEQNYLARVINPAKTTVGALNFITLLATPQTNSVLLRKRQEAIKTFVHDQELHDRCQQLLSSVATHENIAYMFWSFDLLEGTVKHGMKYKVPVFKWLNKKRWGMSFANLDGWVDAIVTLGLGAVTLGSLGIFAFHKCRHLFSTNKDYQFLPDTEKRRIDSGAYFDGLDWKTRALNMVSGNKSGVAAGLSLLAGYFYFYQVRHQFEHLKCRAMGEKMMFKSMSSLSYMFAAIQELYFELCDDPTWRLLPGCEPLFTFFEQTAQEDGNVREMLACLQSKACRSKKRATWAMGDLVRAYLALDQCKDKLGDLFAAVGRIDVYAGLAQKYKDLEGQPNQLCFPTYVANVPTLQCNNLWNPFLSPDVAVSNDIALGGGQRTQHYIVTGPNAAGKSTVLKAIAIGALMGQTCGMVPAESCTMSPFHVLETYLNITDDLQEGNSLFKQEVIRADEVLTRVREVAKEGKPALLVCDEMFNGTTPDEGMSSAYSVAAHFAQQPNVLSSVATHFAQLTDLANQYPAISNMHVSVAKTRSGSWHRSYKLLPGTSNQHVALDMLGEQGIDNSIVALARQVLKRRKTGGKK